MVDPLGRLPTRFTAWPATPPITLAHIVAKWSPISQKGKPREADRIGTEHEKIASSGRTTAPSPILARRASRHCSKDAAEARLGTVLGRGKISALPAETAKARSPSSRRSFELSGGPLETLTRPAGIEPAALGAARRRAMGHPFPAWAQPKWTLAETPRMPKSRRDHDALMRRWAARPGHDVPDLHLQVNLDFSPKKTWPELRCR